MQMLRPAAVAGQWYPGSRDRLAAEVDEYVSRAGVAAVARPPLAIIAPHAGLMYSGPVAACAYGLVRGAAYRAIVLVGPSHFVAFQGVSIWGDGAWDTPFGPVAVDAPLASAIRGASDGLVGELPAAHGREHSLEMQLPFIAHLLPGVPIVPLVMGHQTRQTAFALGDAIAAALAPTSAWSRSAAGEAPPDRRAQAPAPDEEVLIVASSDLSHYEDAPTAATLDAVVMQHVHDIDPEGLMATLEREPRHACGGGPIVSVLQAARRQGATRATVLRYADSGDVSGDKSAVVGYMAAAIW